MISVIFVCFGNICRSPTAEAVFCRMIGEEGLSASFRVTSRATSDCEEGNPVYPPAARELKERGYNFTHRAKQLTLQDVKNADYVLVMDSLNLRDTVRLTGGHYGEKIFKLGQFLTPQLDIDDPWYTGDFARAYGAIYASCRAFLDFLKQKHAAAFGYDRRH